MAATVADAGDLPTGIILPNVAPKCKWARDAPPGSNPHNPQPIRVPNIHDSVLGNILEAYGHTPLVKLDKIAKAEGLECDLLAKCEFMNPGGSMKDRIGIRMIEEAERLGKLKPGGTVIEPTSGNTGIGIALAAAVKGYRCILLMPDKVSFDKDLVLKALGAEVIRCPSAPFGTAEHYISVAYKMSMEIPNSHICDQYRNPWNSMAHFDTTAEEIIFQTEGKFDMMAIAVGTGGTITGIGKKFKEEVPYVEVVGVDPHGSILAIPESLNEGPCQTYSIEGIGRTFMPTGIDRSVVDTWVKTNDQEGFLWARRLQKEEGLLCGSSAGSAIAGAVKAARKLKKGQRCVVLLPDSIRNYLTKFVRDEWMIDKGYIEPPQTWQQQWWWSQPVGMLDLPPLVTLRSDATCVDAIALLHKNNLTAIPVLSGTGEIVGVATTTELTRKMSTAAISPTSFVTEALFKKFEKVSMSTTLGRLSIVINRDGFALVSPTADSKKLSAVATGSDLTNYIVSHPVQNGMNGVNGTSDTNGTNGVNGANGVLE